MTSPRYTSHPAPALHSRRYPVAQTHTDPRFTFRLVLEVAQVLEQHGYPPLSVHNAADLVELRQALFAFLYTGGGGEQA